MFLFLHLAHLFSLQLNFSYTFIQSIYYYYYNIDQFQILHYIMKSNGAIHVSKVNFACLYFELQHFLKLDSIVMNFASCRGREVGMASINIVYRWSFHGQRYLIFKW
jgi:hypothetical protein